MKRESNIELLRIVAMLMVLLLHANYESLGGVSLTDIGDSPISSFGKALAEQMCIICVNLFVLISGWFGIRPSIKGGLSILFQVFFFHALIVALFLGIGEPVSLHTIAVGFYLGCPYWFITAYLVLYAISPILNAFIDRANPRVYLSVLSAFFFLEFAYGWLTNAAAFINGYTAISFVGLYLLAQFIRRYSRRLSSIGVGANLSLYLLFSVVPVILYFLTGHKFNMLAYSSPFVILSSVFFFLAFRKMELSSRAINYLACSSLSIYLVHMHPSVMPYFIDLMRGAYEMLGGYWYMLFAVVFAICFGLACMLLDKLRISLWHLLCYTVIDKALYKWECLVDKVYSRLGI